MSKFPYLVMLWFIVTCHTSQMTLLQENTWKSMPSFHRTCPICLALHWLYSISFYAMNLNVKNNSYWVLWAFYGSSRPRVVKGTSEIPSLEGRDCLDFITVHFDNTWQYLKQLVNPHRFVINRISCGQSWPRSHWKRNVKQRNACPGCVWHLYLISLLHQPWQQIGPTGHESGKGTSSFYTPPHPSFPWCRVC